MSVAERIAEVQSVVAAVRDPEIDESAGELDFVVDVAVVEGEVSISVRLPSFWCPANFAWLMAQDMREAVLSLPWVTGFRLQLIDHFADEQISRGVSDAQTFEAAFPAHAVSDLSVLKRDFAAKAMLMRQGRFIAALRTAGMDDASICKATIDAMNRLCEVPDLGLLWNAVMEKRREANIGHDDSKPAICDAKGESISNLDMHLREIRRVSTNAAASGEMCRLLVAGRRIGGGCAAFAPRPNNTRQETTR